MIAAARAAVVSLGILGACHRTAPLGTCTDPLDGTWRTDGGERWMVIDHGTSLEAYTLFDDTRPIGAPAGIEISPRTLELSRTSQAVAGEVRRRYLRAADPCVGKAPAHLLGCQGDTIELVLADPAAPIAYAPCGWGRPAASHRERWRRDSQ